MDGIKLGVLGGTFDPPHVGHLILAEMARWQLSLERVVFVPAGDPWRKEARRVTSAADRLAMVRLAVGADPFFEVSAIEVERSGPSYSVETLAALGERLGPGCELYFVLGEDALRDLPNWKEPRRIIELAWLAVAPRVRGAAGDKKQPAAVGPRRLVSEALRDAIPGIAERVIVLDMPVVEISATWLRERARSGGSLRHLVPPNVEDYIRRHGLYEYR